MSATRGTERVAGVLGGTFDPVHVGHLQLAHRVARALGLPSMLLMLAARPPHKAPGGLSPPDARLSMLRLAVADQSGLEVSTLELEREGVGYTIDTLRDLRQGNPPTNPLFVVGMDALRDLPNWRLWRDLIDEFDFVAVDRPSLTLDDARPDLAPEISKRLVIVAADAAAGETSGWLDPGAGGRIFYIPGGLVAVSSSEIRSRAARGESLDGLVPPAVAGYILENRLYSREENP